MADSVDIEGTSLASAMRRLTSFSIFPRCRSASSGGISLLVASDRTIDSAWNMVGSVRELRKTAFKPEAKIVPSSSGEERDSVASFVDSASGYWEVYFRR